MPEGRTRPTARTPSCPSSPGWPASSSRRATPRPRAPSCAPPAVTCPDSSSTRPATWPPRPNRSASWQSEVDQLAAVAAPGDARVKDIRDQADALAPLVGTQAVRGPVITVSLNDAHRSAASLPKPYGPDDIVVHQQDVQGVVNALWGCTAPRR